MSSNPTQTVNVDDLAGMVTAPPADDFTTHLGTLEKKFQNKFGKSLTITGGANTPMHRQLHGGNARDIRSKDLTPEQRDWIIEFGTRKGLLAADYTDPAVNPNRVKQPHIHIQAADHHPAPRAGIQTMSVDDLEKGISREANQPNIRTPPMVGDKVLESALSRFTGSAARTVGIPTSFKEAGKMIHEFSPITHVKGFIKALKSGDYGEAGRELPRMVLPITIMGESIAKGQFKELKEAYQQWESEGGPDVPSSKTLEHFLAGVVPVIGPQAEQGLEKYRAGDYAGAAGVATGIAAEIFGPKLVKSGLKGIRGLGEVKTGEILPGGPLPGSVPRGTSPTIVDAELVPKGEARGTGYRNYEIQRQGKPIGSLQAVISEDGKTAKISSVQVAGGPNKLGPKAVLGLRRQLQAEHPSLEKITGLRVTGARSGRGQQMVVRMPPAAQEAFGKAPSTALTTLGSHPANADVLPLPGQFSSLEPTPPTFEGEPVVEQGLAQPPPATAGPAVNQPQVAGQLPPGSQPATMKDVAWYKAEFGSPDQVMESRPETAPVAQVLTRAADEGGKFVGTFERSLANTVKNLNRAARREQGDILNNYADPSQAFGQISQVLGRPYSGRAVVAAIQARRILDTVHSMFPRPFTHAGTNVGYIQAYLTHMEEMLGTDSDLLAGVKQAWEYHFKRPLASLRGLWAEPDVQVTGRSRPLGGGEAGHPSSVYTRHRTGQLSPVELDTKRIFPAYIESAKRAIFDKPAVDATVPLIEKLPKSNLRDLATATVRNFSRYDAYPGLSQAWESFTSGLMRTHARSVLGFSTGLQALHFARIWGNLLPALETKYFAYGWKELMTHPVESYRTVARLGMLTGEIRPSAFKTLGEKFDSLMQLKSAADYMDRAIGYHGFKKMYLDQGMSPYDAEMAALKSTKRASMFPDPTRTAKIFMTEKGVGSSAIGKLALQYKQVPVKIIEQYVRIAAQAKANPAAFGRMMAGIGLLVTAQQILGIKALHLNLKSLLDLRGATPAEIIKIFDLAGKGKIDEAIQESLLLLIPGGLSLEHQLDTGPSAFEKEPKEKKPGLERLKGLTSK